MVRSFKPDLIPKAQLHVEWRCVVMRHSTTGAAGLSYQRNDKGTQLIEYRDARGELRGVLKLCGTGEALCNSGQLLLMVDPEHRRRGIATALLAEAGRRGLAIRFETQQYTRPGWATIRKYLDSRAEEQGPAACNPNG